MCHKLYTKSKNFTYNKRNENIGLSIISKKNNIYKLLKLLNDFQLIFLLDFELKSMDELSLQKWNHCDIINGNGDIVYNL